MFTRRLLHLKIHSRRVKIIKRTLPVFAFLLASFILILPTLKEQKDTFSLALNPIPKGKEATLAMSNIRFFSTDEKNQPLRITSPQVDELDKEKKIAKLISPKLIYEMKSGTVLNGITDFALVYQKEENLNLSQPVFITTSDGWKAKTQNVIFDYKTAVANGENEIFITGPEGELTADSFLMYDKGNFIEFRKNVKVIIKNKGKKIVLTSTNGAKVNQEKKIITFKQDVKAIQDGQTLIADKMILYYKENKGYEVKKIETFGNVLAISKTKEKIKGDIGNYNVDTGIITMKENVQLTKNDNIIYTDIADLNLKTGMTTLSPKQGNTKRVHGQLIPADIDKK